MEYRKTLNLPTTGFSMKANLREKEPQIIKRWESEALYDQILQARKEGKPYILHDGPPYANGEIHIGHALNKVLKDIIVKYRTMTGRYSPYVPGWDCHGLPIELHVVRDLKAKKKEYTLDILRKACRSYAEKYVKIQKKDFQRLGIFGLWDDPYLTMSHHYESVITETFGKLVHEGYIYRGLKPVHWCPSCETALAEAEVEHQNHSSPTVYVRFSVNRGSLQGTALKDKKTSVVIWTTTPWTLPANMAVCFHPEYKYAAYKTDGEEYLILAEELAGSTLEKFGMYIQEKIPLEKAVLENIVCKHPFVDREVKPVFDTYVTLDTGTGIVHIAPGHGEDDHKIGLRYGLDVFSPVDRSGRYTDEFELMKGMQVFEANKPIVDLLKEKNALLFTDKIEHSYPHCWRCKNPVIFRATQQWFMKIDHNDLRKKAAQGVKNTTWVPSWGEERMANMLQNRPDWCLSRQRAWGVPIPAFYCGSCGETLLNNETVDYFVKIVREKSVDVWFTEPAEKLLPEGTKCPQCGKSDFHKETDILDVWFDSGASHRAVLQGRDYMSSPADLYLEGSDQYRGWFQSSLWPSMALSGEPPYRTVLTHGFLLDESGKAMHKSAGNAIPPQKIVDQYGADILRLWVVSSDYSQDIALGQEILKRISESYRLVRNSIRYMLGNLNGFKVSSDRLDLSNLEGFDKWALRKLYRLVRKVNASYEKFEFNTIFHQLNNFCAVELSSTYFNILKDRLYTEPLASLASRSSRTVLSLILEYLIKMIAPILPFTADESWQAFKTELEAPGTGSVHLELFPEDLPDVPGADEAEDLWDRILATRPAVQKALEVKRNGKVIGDSLEAKVRLFVKKDKLKAFLLENKNLLPMAYIASQVEIMEQDTVEDPVHETDELKIDVQVADGGKCVRCWNRTETVGTHADHPELCTRCVSAVSELKDGSF